MSLGRISCPSVSLKISKCTWVSLNFSELSFTPRVTLDSTVFLIFSWCPSKLLSVPYVSFKYLKYLTSLGTLLIYCSSKDEDFHVFPKISVSFDWSNTPHCPVSLGRYRCPSVSPNFKVSLGSLIAHCPSEVGCTFGTQNLKISPDPS